MALAETAQLAVNLTLGGNFTSGLAQAEGSLSRFNASAAGAGVKTGIVASAFGGLRTAAVGVGGALSHAAGQIKNLVTGPLGLIGLGGGLFALGGALTTSIRKMEDFGQQLEQVKTLTGETDVAAGALILQFEKFGLSDRLPQLVGFTEKTLGKLNETASKSGSSISKLAEFDKQYGLSLIDSSGKVADFSTVLGELAKFYDTNADASTKAYVASQIFGRSYTAMIPLLNEGSAGLRQAAADAAALGLSSTTTADQILAFHDQMHALENQVNVLQLSIGMALLPTLQDVATTLTTFVQSHRSDIVNFVRDATNVAKSGAKAIGDLVGGLSKAWGMVPPELQKLLVGGFIADKTIKFLFGIDPAKLVLNFAGSAISNAMGAAVGKGIISAGLGKLFVQPVFVTNPGFGGLGGLGGAAGGAAGAAEGAAGAAAGGSLLAATAAVAAVGALSLGGAAIIGGIAHTLGYKEGPQDTGYHGFMSGSQFNAVNAGLNAVSPEDIQHHREESKAAAAAALSLEDFEHKLRGSNSALGPFGKAIADLDPKLRTALGRTSADIMKEIHDQSVARFGGQGLGQAAEQGTFRRKMERWAEYIAGSSESSAQKLADLKRVEDDLKAAGIRVPPKIDALIQKVKDQQISVTSTANVNIHISGGGAGSTVTKNVSLAATASKSAQVERALGPG